MFVQTINHDALMEQMCLAEQDYLEKDRFLDVGRNVLSRDCRILFMAPNKRCSDCRHCFASSVAVD